MRVRLVLVGILGAVAGALALATGFATGFLEVNSSVIASAAQPSEADQVQALAERLLSPALPGPDGRAPSTRLLVGQWPTGLPLDLPIPPAGHLVGSAIRTTDGSVMAVDGVLDVRDAVDPSQPGPCATWSGPPPGGPGADLLPPLVAPTGVMVQMQGATNGPNRVASEASAMTDQASADLETHFARQLQAAGWQRLAGGVDGPLAWSSWKVPREGEWQGLLFVLDGPGQHRRGLYVRVESAAQPGRGWGAGSLSIVSPASAPAAPPSVPRPMAAPTPASPNPTPAPTWPLTRDADAVRSRARAAVDPTHTADRSCRDRQQRYRGSTQSSSSPRGCSWRV